MVLTGSISAPCMAQVGTAGKPFIQSGLGGLPGVGLQAGFVRARSFFTVEAIVYFNAPVPPGHSEGGLQISGGLGGAIRPLGIMRTIGNATYPYDLDVGFRFGPSLYFANNPTKSDKNQQFSLFLEPYLRFNSRLNDKRIYFIELGTQRPIFRVGFWFNL